MPRILDSYDIKQWYITLGNCMSLERVKIVCFSWTIWGYQQYFIKSFNPHLQPTFNEIMKLLDKILNQLTITLTKLVFIIKVSTLYCISFKLCNSVVSISVNLDFFHCRGHRWHGTHWEGCVWSKRNTWERMWGNHGFQVSNFIFDDLPEAHTFKL